jgi:hypothetical protein
MRYSDVNFNNVSKNDKGGPTEIHTFLLQNQEYRMMFADAVYRHFFNDGVFTPASLEESFLHRKNEIESAVILESARWGDFLESSTNVTYTKNDHWVPEVSKVLSEYIPKRRDIVLGQLRGVSPKLFPTSMPPVFRVEDHSSVLQKKIELVNPNSTEGDIYYTLDGSDPRAVGGVVKGLKYTKAIEIENSTIIKARFLTRGLQEWSALAEKLVVFETVYGKEVVISEILYHPENDKPEFIEIVNTGETSVILDGFVFTKGIDFTFRQGSIFPGTGLVLTSDTALFKKVYGFSAFGQFNKQLDNNGETLILKNRFSQTVDSVTYSDTIPWPVAADGDGFSLELINQESDNSIHTYWKASEVKEGTPFEPQTGQDMEATFYPNPFTDKFFIELENADLVYEPFKVEVFNLFGSVVKSMETKSNHSRIELNLSNLLPGMYVIRITPLQNISFEFSNIKAIKLK